MVRVSTFGARYKLNDKVCKSALFGIFATLAYYQASHKDKNL